MSRRRTTPKQRQVWASDLPAIRDAVMHDWATLDITDPYQPVAGTLEGIHDELRDGDLWWVAPPMTRLAIAAARDLPEWTPHLARPSLAGIVIWSPSTGLDLIWSDAPTQHRKHSALTGAQIGPSLRIIGLSWFPSVDGGMEIEAISDDPRLCGADPARPVGSDAMGHGSPGRWGPSHTLHEEQLWNLLGATWLLASQPTIGVRRPPRDEDAPRFGRRPADPSPISVVTLREIATDPTGQREDALTPSGRTPPRRHIVHGFWRQQACGPSRQWRKPIFIAPYLRGRGDLIEKDRVQVWRR